LTRQSYQRGYVSTRSQPVGVLSFVSATVCVLLTALGYTNQKLLKISRARKPRELFSTSESGSRTIDPSKRSISPFSTLWMLCGGHT
jgi:hypothetical protein